MWQKLTPRIGATLALGERRQDGAPRQLRDFASQLPAAQAAFVSPIQYAYAYYNAVDKDLDGIAQLGEVLVNQGLQGFSGFDPKNPTAAVNKVAAGSKPQVTHELLAGFDIELTPQFSVSGTATYRKMIDVPWTPLVSITQANYTQTSTLTGTLPEIGALQRAAVPG